MSRRRRSPAAWSPAGRAVFFLSLAVLLLFPAALPAGVIRVEGHTYRLDNAQPVTGMWAIAEALAAANDVAIVVVSPDAAPTEVQSLLELLATLKVPTALTKKADYDQLVSRGVLRGPAAP